MMRSPASFTETLRLRMPSSCSASSVSSWFRSDFDAVAAVGLAGLDFAQEDDAVAGFLHGDAEVADAIKLLGQFGEFVVVRGEERFGARAGVDVLDHGPGQRQAI